MNSLRLPGSSPRTVRHILLRSLQSAPSLRIDVLTNPATSGLAETYLKPLGISSMLDAPVWVGGKVIGVLCHEHTGPSRDWSAEEVDFVSALAAMVSLALEESSRAQSEHLRRESEERFSKAFRTSPVNITILRLERQEVRRGKRCIRTVVRVGPGQNSWP